MFPIDSNDAYRNSDGSLSKMGDVIGGDSELPEYTSSDAGKSLQVDDDGKLIWGSTFTPDYENEVLNIGDANDYHYFIPMSKTYIGDGDTGYEIKTAADSSASAAKIELYQIIVKNGEILGTNYITTLVHNGTHEYSDENISVEYAGTQWSVSSSKDFVDLTTGDAVQFPVSWSYNTNVDYKWYMSTGE